MPEISAQQWHSQDFQLWSRLVYFEITIPWHRTT